MEPTVFEHRRLKVYVAGPISKGDVAENVAKGIEYGKMMLRDGLAPYIPHLDTYMFGHSGESEWNGLLEWDLEWVAASDALFRIAGESAGADLEVKVARSLGIPVFYNYAMLVDYAFLKGLTGKQKVRVP
jgi:hypothetical protein